MMNLDHTIDLSLEEIKYLDNLANPSKYESESWDNYKNDAVMKVIKNKIKEQLQILQNNKCIYCMRIIKTRTNNEGDREHFAYKNKYPQFTFNKYNLMISCQECNRGLKGIVNTVHKKNNYYPRCEFSIVHPIIDIIDKHLNFFENSIIRAKTVKGFRTIKLFKLDSTALTREREKEYRQQLNESLPDNLLDSIDAAINFNLYEA
ncbi:MAG: hypothetical protein WA945_08180 [Arcobacteraceae bacterium]